MKKVILALLLVVFSFPAVAKDKESVYDRVMKTGTIRCGWNTWSPIFMKDPNTEKFSGIFYEFSEAMGEVLDLKIEWVGPISWSDYPVALELGRIDGMCAGIWPVSKRGKVIDFSTPLYYLPFMAYARADDNRFDKDIGVLNSAEYTITSTDGEVSSEIAKISFPNAMMNELPQFSDVSQNFLNVVNKKADIYLNDIVSYYEFNNANPNQLKIVPTKTPIRIFANTIAVKRGEEEFRRMLNNSIQELHQAGVVEKIISKYEKYPNSFLRVAKPYEEAK